MKTKVFFSSLLVLSFLCFSVFAQTGEGPSKKISLMKKQPAAQEQPQMRGSGDPLKGLGVAEAEQAMEIGDYYALIIGIDDYSGTWDPLRNAVNDAKTLEATLKESYKFDHFQSLYNNEATRINILKEMDWLRANATEHDNVLIYYSGHGQYDEMMNKGFWVPVDAHSDFTGEMISNNDIQAYLTGIKSKHTLLISDACFSGDIFRGSVSSVPFEENDRYYRKIHGLTSRKAITSGGIEPVMDGGGNGHSVFAYYLLQQLTSNNKRFFDATELYGGIKIPVTNNSEQRPEFQPIKNTGDEGGQFVFIKK
jgi:hypothetical protein